RAAVWACALASESAMKVFSSFWIVVSGALLVGVQACVFDHVEECQERLTCSGGAAALPTITTSATGAGGGVGGANVGGTDLGGGGANAGGTDLGGGGAG